MATRRAPSVIHAMQQHVPRMLVVLLLANVASEAPVARASELAAPMQFTLHQECEGTGCQSYILAQGTIVTDTAETFRTFVSRIGFLPAVYFNSPGGDLAAGVKLGLAIRKAQLDTHVGGAYQQFVGGTNRYETLVREGICLSACAYAFLGGVSRELGKRGTLGVHQFRGERGDSGESSAQIAVAALATYVDQMGADRRLLDLAASASPNQIRVLSTREARDLNVDNTVPPRAHWRLEADSTGQLFLVASQRQARRDGVVSFMLTRSGTAVRAVLSYRIRQSFRSEADLREMFSGQTFFLVRLANVTYQLTPQGKWTQSQGSFVIVVDVPKEALSGISNAAEFELDAEWPNAMRDIRPSAAFGTTGFRNGLAALSRR